MYFSLIITIVFLLVIIIASLQNSMPLNLKFIAWDIHISLTALIFFSSLLGGAIVAVLTLPKLARKSLDVKRSKQDIHKLKEKILELGERQEGESQTG